MSADPDMIDTLRDFLDEYFIQLGMEPGPNGRVLWITPSGHIGAWVNLDRIPTLGDTVSITLGDLKEQ